MRKFIHTSRRAITIVELLVALVIVTLLVGGLYALLLMSGRAELQTLASAEAIAHAELALGRIAADLRCMRPPDLTSPAFRVTADGRGLSFYRLEVGRGALVARPVTYRLRTVAPRRHALLRDGRPVPGVLLADLLVEVEEDRDDPAGAAQEGGANPRLKITLVGAGPVRRGAGAADVHLLTMTFPVPDTSPAAMIGLPREALDLMASVVTTQGQLQP